MTCDAGVWSPAGGWYCDPVHWKRNTMFAFGWAPCYLLVCLSQPWLHPDYVSWRSGRAAHIPLLEIYCVTVARLDVSRLDV